MTLTSPTDLRDLLLRYLLGEMDPQEREEIDTRLIADPEFAAAFEDAQNDLLDEHAAGTLVPADSIRVHHAIARNSAVARAALMAAALRVASQRLHPAAEDGHRHSKFKTGVPAWAIAACGLLIAGGIVAAAGWRFLSSSPAKSSPVQSTVAIPAPSTAAPTTSETRSVPSSVAPPSAEQARRPAAVLEATLVLPESSRSSEASVLQVGRSVQRIRVQWPVAAEVQPNQSLTLTVLQNANQIAQVREARPRRTISGTPVAEFAIPASSLQPATYLFRISNASAAGEPPLVELAVDIKRS